MAYSAAGGALCRFAGGQLLNYFDTQTRHGFVHCLDTDKRWEFYLATIGKDRENSRSSLVD